MKTIEMVAYQTVDPENDIWCNKAFLFESQEQANEFFKQPKNVLEALQIELSENEKMHGFRYEVTADGNENTESVSFYCDEAHDVFIGQMSRGFVIK